MAEGRQTLETQPLDDSVKNLEKMYGKETEHPLGKDEVAELQDDEARVTAEAGALEEAEEEALDKELKTLQQKTDTEINLAEQAATEQAEATATLQHDLDHLQQIPTNTDDPIIAVQMQEAQDKLDASIREQNDLEKKSKQQKTCRTY